MPNFGDWRYIFRVHASEIRRLCTSDMCMGPAFESRQYRHDRSNSRETTATCRQKHTTRPGGFKLYCDMHVASQTSQAAHDGQAAAFFETLDTSDTFLEQTGTPTTFSSTEEFSCIVRHLEEKHSQLIVRSALQVNWRMFRQGVSPCWEDPLNADGGKWAVSFVDVSPDVALERLSTIMSSVIDGSFPNHHLVNGAVLSVKDWGYRLSIWTSRIPSKASIARGCKWLRANVQPKYSGFYAHRNLTRKDSRSHAESSTVISDQQCSTSVLSEDFASSMSQSVTPACDSSDSCASSEQNSCVSSELNFDLQIEDDGVDAHT